VLHPFFTPRVAVSGRRRGRAATAHGRGRARRIGSRGGILFAGGEVDRCVERRIDAAVG
jgi:hypothetical protein